ncbi:PP2C family protein-serine/threonine phosphatase [Streptomyces sp. NPDC004542]|uniref:PP2C family protein-serine/threonine phosphatase n=1 Tax=Streptomyces sp. NPDC004542 TaxID=3154281 RepID=UPI0033A80963
MHDVNGERVVALSRHPLLLTVAVALLPVLLLGVDVATPSGIRMAPMMVSAPALAAVFCAPAGVLLVIVVTLPCVVLASVANQQLGTDNFPAQLGTITLISLAALAASAARTRKERQLARSRWVAEVTQRVLLHPLPERVGSFEVASLYQAADEEAAIGGDLYAVAHHGERTHVLLGDVQGKGLASLEMVSCVLNSFRRSARHRSPLTEMVRELSAAFGEEIRDLSAVARTGSCSGSQYGEESFATAVLLDLPEDGPVRLANLGHPPPLLLLEDGTVTSLEPTVPVPPLGLEELNGGQVVVDTADVPPGATLLLYTDGVTEARNASGDFYPLAERVRSWTGLSPQELLDTVRADLRAYVGGPRLSDDVAMVAVRRVPARVPAEAHAGERADARGTAAAGRGEDGDWTRRGPATLWRRAPRRTPLSRRRRTAPAAATPPVPSAAASPAGP